MKMPNWCENKVLLTNLDVSVVNEIVENVKEGRNGPAVKDTFCGLFGLFLPMPEELKTTTKGSSGKPETDDEKSKSIHLIDKYGFDNWYDWSIKNWGTKWEVQWDSVRINERSETSIDLSFDTAWSPPTYLYDYLVERKIGVTASYVETGMNFIGCYSMSCKECWELDKNAPDFLLEEWAEYLLMCLMDEDEEEDFFDDDEKEDLESFRAYRKKLKSFIREGDEKEAA